VAPIFISQRLAAIRLLKSAAGRRGLSLMVQTFQAYSLLMILETECTQGSTAMTDKPLFENADAEEAKFQAEGQLDNAANDPVDEAVIVPAGAGAVLHGNMVGGFGPGASGPMPAVGAAALDEVDDDAEQPSTDR
jgi:hypothetical protein